MTIFWVMVACTIALLAAPAVFFRFMIWRDEHKTRKPVYVPRYDRASIPQDIDALTKRLSALSREISEPELRDMIYRTVKNVRTLFRKGSQSSEAALFAPNLRLCVENVMKFHDALQQKCTDQVLVGLFDEAMVHVTWCGERAGELLQQRQPDAVTRRSKKSVAVVEVPSDIQSLVLAIEKLRPVVNDPELNLKVSEAISST